MKKMFCILWCLLFCISCALASEAPQFPLPFPVPDEGIQDVIPGNNASEGLRVNLNGSDIFLDFDSSADYSYSENGISQASFYAYADNDKYLYEAYFVFPENVTSGTTVDPEYAIRNNVQECSVSLIISDNSGETYYWAMQMNGAAYPQGADYAIRFDSVASTASGTVYTGSLSATLVDVDMVSGKTSGSLSIENAPFSFTMPAGVSPAPLIPFPKDPAPAPTPTIRPDMFRI